MSDRVDYPVKFGRCSYCTASCQVCMYCSRCEYCGHTRDCKLPRNSQKIANLEGQLDKQRDWLDWLENYKRLTHRMPE